MKALITLLLLSLSIGFSTAQETPGSQKHLAFKGVPIDGTLDEFVANLEKKGFKLIDTRGIDLDWSQIFKGDFSSVDEERPFNRNEILKEGEAKLLGDFAGFRKCILSVSTLNDKDIVNTVSVSFPNQDTWPELSSDYYLLKELLTEKYGTPQEIIEKFTDLNRSPTDSDKMHEVYMERFKFFSKFTINSGVITVSIHHRKYVSLTYHDRINSEIIRAKAIDDL